MSKMFWIPTVVILIARAARIGSEQVDNIMQQTLQSVQWLGFGLLVISALLIAGLAEAMKVLRDVAKPFRAQEK